MRRTTVVALVGMLLALGLVGCRGATTRAAVRNEAIAPVTVVVTGQGGLVTFADVAPNTTSAFQKLPFEALKGLRVSVNGGSPTGLNMTEQGDNVMTVSPGGAVTLDVQDNPDNKPFW